MHNYQGFPGVAFIAGRQFQTEYGTHEPGTVVKEAPLFPNLDVLVSAGYLYPYSPGNGYEYLPPHLFTSTNLKEEIDALLAGDPTPGTQQFPDGEKPEVMVQAEREAEQQNEIRETLRNRQLLKREAAPESEQQPAAKKTATKTAAKKAAATDQKDEK